MIGNASSAGWAAGKDAAARSTMRGGANEAGFDIIAGDRQTTIAVMKGLSGCLDAVEFDLRRGWVANGWAFDGAAPERPVVVEIVGDDETVLGAGVADQFREDLQAAGLGSGSVAFTIDLPPGMAMQSEHFLELREAETKSTIVPATLFEINRFGGYLDGLQGAIVAGWAFDCARLAVPVVVEIAVDGEFAGHAVADRFRQDLAEIGFVNAYHGFEWVLPPRFADGQPHRIAAHIANTGTELDCAAPDFLVLPGRLTPEASRLLDLYAAARQNVAVIEQAFRSEAGRPRAADPQSVTDLLLDSLDPAPEFETSPVP